MAENKVSIIIEAYNNAKKTFQDLIKDADNFKLKMGEIDSILKSMVGIAALYGIGRGLDDVINTAEKTQNSLRGLAAVARYSGENIGKSIQAGADLASDGLLNVQASSQALQNLLSRGFSLEESIKIIERLKDAAAFNRQSHLSMSEAVTSATEGLKNENSILVDNAGVTKNVSIMWKEYAAQIGKGANDLTQAEKRQAEFNGIMRETEGQVGNAKLALDGITGTKAKLSQEVFKLKNALGESLTPAFLGLAKAGNWVLENFIKPFLGGLEITATRVAMWWEKIGVIINEYRNSRNVAGIPIDIDLSRVKGRFKELDAAFEEQSSEIVKKYSGAVSVPEIGKDTGKRRQDVVTPPKAEKVKAGDEIVSLAGRDFYKKTIDFLADVEKQFSDQKKKDLEEINDLHKMELESAEDYAKWQNEEAQKRKQARESEIQYQLAIIDLKEKEHLTSPIDATKERIRLQEELLRIQEAGLDGLNKATDPASWYAQADAVQKTRDALLGLNHDLKEQSGGTWEGFRYGMDEFIRTARSRFQEGEELAKTTASAMSDAFSNFFIDAVQGRLKSFGDYVRAFLMEIYSAMARMMAQKVTANLLMSFASGAPAPGSIGPTGIDYGPLGATIHHTGGVVPGYVPRFHFGGLNSDERVAINKVGERYITQEQNEWLTALSRQFKSGGGEGGDVHHHYHISALDPKSWSDFVRRNPGPILDSFNRDMRTAGATRSSVRAYG